MLFPNFFIIFSFSEFNDHYWPTKLLKSRRWLLDGTFETKNGFDYFIAKLKAFFLILPFSVLWFINKVRKLDVAVTNPIMEDNPVAFSLFRLGFLSFSFSFTFYLSLSDVDSALQLLLCGVMSPSLILIINEL